MHYANGIKPLAIVRMPPAAIPGTSALSAATQLLNWALLLSPRPPSLADRVIPSRTSSLL